MRPRSKSRTLKQKAFNFDEAGAESLVRQDSSLQRLAVDDKGWEVFRGNISSEWHCADVCVHLGLVEDSIFGS